MQEEQYSLILQFENQGEFMYKVPIVKLQNISLQEMNEKKLYYSQLKTNEFVEIKSLSELNEMILLNKINLRCRKPSLTVRR